MAQLVLAVAGAAIGSAFGPAGAQIGFALGSAIGSSLGPGTTTEGPRLSDLKVQVSTYGASIPRGKGGFPVAGNVIWSTDLQQQRNSEEVGKGGPSQTSVTYTYSVSCAIVLHDGQIAGMRRVWADSKLVYDARDDADADTIDASAEFAEFFTLYRGTPDQLPDPTMEAEKGVGNVPAYLDTAYIVFKDLPLADYGNRIPNFVFEIFTEGAPAPAQGDGILNHFEELDGDGMVVSEVGPNMLMTGGAALSESLAKWGDSGGDADGVGKNFGATGMTGSLNRSWRLEGWWWVDEDQENFFRLGSGSTFPTVSLAREGVFNDACFNIGSVSNAGSGGGRFGSVGLRPALGAWAHLGLEYDPATNNVYAFCNGTRVGIAISGSGGNPFQDGVFTQCNVYGDCDDFFLHFDVDLYGESYAVPTGPFEANNNGETFTPGQVFLQEVVSGLCTDCGLDESQIDVTALPDVEVLGYVRTKQMPGRAALEPLRQAFYFDAVESEGKVKFVPRGASSSVTIPDADLGAIEGSADPQPATETVRAQESELPAVVNVVYLDRDRDYENGTQTAMRVVTGSVQQVTLEMPIVLTNQHGSDAAAVNLYDAWTARTDVSWSTTKKYAATEPTDIVTLVDGPLSLQARITEVLDDGPVRKFKGRYDKPSVYDPNTTPNVPSGTGAVIRVVGETVIEQIDSPIFRDADDDAGRYIAARGTKAGWNGGVLYESTDSGASYSSILTVSKTTTMGVTLTALQDFGGGYIVDETSFVDVQLYGGTLATITRDELLSYGQAAIIGNEVVPFMRAELIGDKQYRLSGFLRGARGTEDQIGVHAIGDRFILISEATWYRADELLSRVGNEYLYKAVTAGKSLEAATATAFTNTARGLKPLAPVDLRCSRDGSGGFRITWARRSRYNTPFLGTSAIPLGETSEAYEVDILDGADVVRTIATTSEAATYNAAQQTADFGAVQSSIDVVVYQMSGSVGRGLPLTGTLSTSYTPATQSNTITLGGTFAAGVKITVYANGTQIATRTSISGDTDLAGVASGLASVINALASYNASAVGSVITVTGTPGAVYTLTAVVGGNTAISSLVTQQAAESNPGSRYVAHCFVSNLATGETEPIPTGTTFTLTVKQNGLSMAMASFTTTHESLRSDVIFGLVDAVQDDSWFADNDMWMTAATSDIGGVYGEFVGPQGDPTWGVFGSGSAPFSIGVSVTNPGSEAVAEDQPQIVQVTVSGTPVNGEVFRVKLNGTSYPYTATVPSDTREEVIDGLVALIDATTDFSAVQLTSTKFSITGPSTDEFTYTTSITRGSTATVA